MDQMQSSLVEMFNQLRELRRRLDVAEGNIPVDTVSKVVPLFTSASQSADKSHHTTIEEIESARGHVRLESESGQVESTTDSTSISHTETEVLVSSVQPETSPIESTETTTPSPVTDSRPTSSMARVSRLLDPISRELETGDATADVIAEYLQTAKDDLITKQKPNDRVARDMDIVLNFLRARGKRGIRSEERENILKRIKRWKVHLK